MKRLLLFTLTLAMLTVANVQQVRAYSTDDLTSAGWTQVTDITDMTSMTLSDYYFIFVDAGTSNYSVANPLPGTNERPAYQVLIDPLADKSQLWKLSYDSANERYAIQSAVDDWYFQGGTGANQGWTDLMSNVLNDNCYFTFANSDGKFSITSTISTGTFVGPWNDNGAVNLAGDRYESLACNKNAAQAPGYYIYYISRSTYDAAYTTASAALTANGWTLVNTAEGLGLDGYYYAFVDCSEDGYESNLVMAGSTNSRPNYQVFDANATIQHWNLIAKGEGFQMQNRYTNTYAVCNDGASWNTGFTNDADNQYTEFRFTLADGKWTICNVCATDNFLGRWENSPLRPAIGESIAANKAAAAGKRLFLIYSIPTIARVAQALPESGAVDAGQWYYFDVNPTDAYILSAGKFADVVYVTDGSLLASEAIGTVFSDQVQELSEGRYYIKSLSAGRYYIKSSSANTFNVDPVSITLPEGQMNVDIATAQQSAKEAFDADKSFENYEALLTAIDNANASIAIYQTMNKYITAQKATAGTTINWSDIDTKYSTGEYVSATDFIADYHALVVNALGETTTANTDMTPYIINPGFEFADNTGWNGGGAVAGLDGQKNIESYNSDNFNIHQVLTDLPNGTYTLTVQGFYRPGDNNNRSDAQNAELYGNDKSIAVKLVASEGKAAADGNGFTTENTNSGSSVYVPDSQADAAKAFATGAYENEVTFVVNNGTVNIGFKKDVLIDKDWTCFDNFRLTYLSAGAEVAPELVNAPMNDSIRTAQQAALDTWNANKTMDNYNALLAAIAAAQASADKYVIINQRIPKLDAQTDVNVTALTTKYDNGDYVEADEVFDAYQEILATAFGTPAADTDMTAFIINPDFEWGDADGWAPNYSDDTAAKSATDPKYEFTNSHGDYIFNTWSGNGDFLWLVQDVKRLPAGTYELSAVWATDDGYRTIEFTAENVLPGNVVDGQQVTDSFRPVDINTRSNKEMGHVRTVTVMVTDGTLRIGGHALGFFKADNFQLKYLGSGIVDPDPNIDDPKLCLPMNKYERNYYITARNAYNDNQTPENLRKVSEYRIMVENSIKAYKAAKKTLDHVKDMMDHTNVYTYDAFFTVDDLFRKYGFDGYYGYRTLEDDQAYELERMFFGTGVYRNTSNFSIPAVPFLASAWDCGYQDDKHKGYAYAQEGWEEGSDYYVNTWSREGNDDGTLMLTPYLEYWKLGNNRLNPRVMTATVEGTPNAIYTVKMFVRVRIDERFTPKYEDPATLTTYADSIALDPNSIKPQGMYIQIGNGTKFYPTWIPIRNENSIYKLNNERQLWVCNLWDVVDPANLPTGDVGSDGTLQIKFGIEKGSNVTWLSMKDVYVNYESEVPASEKAKLKKQIDYAKKRHTTGFDPDEYAPYTNVPQLIALHRAEQVWDSPKNVFLVRAVTKALKAANYSGDKTGDDDDSATVLAYDASTDLWTKNTEEMNGFYWKNDYTSADVEHIEWYDYKDDCITPTGWNLIGRDDGFNTGIKKLGVNIGTSNDDPAEGMKAIEDATGLYAKYETDYGNEPGYTVPLKKDVKYIMTFTYTYAGEGTCPETRVTLTVPKANADDTATSGLEVTRFTPAENGVNDMSKWYMYRATFTPTYNNAETGGMADYLITFDKDNYDPEPIILGELTLVRYKEADDVINGESKDFGNEAEKIPAYSYTPEFIGTDVQVTRSFNKGAYNTLVLPFKLSGSELKEALGNNFDGKVYYFTGVGTTVNDHTYQLKFEERTGGIFANVPVLFYSDASNPVNDWTNKTFTNMVTKYVKNDLTVDSDPFDFVGTYKVQKVPVGGWYIKADNNFYKSTAEKQANIQPTRGYFIPYDTVGNPIMHAKLMGFDIDDEPTGIMAIEEDGSMRVTSGNIYSVDGRLVRQNAKTLEGLPRGTYIVDGKKYMIK